MHPTWYVRATVIARSHGWPLRRALGAARRFQQHVLCSIAYAMLHKEEDDNEGDGRGRLGRA
eukprot:769909-Pyramimonas_sp.AAC.1